MKKSNRLKPVENIIECTKKTLKFTEIYDIINIIFSIINVTFGIFIIKNRLSLSNMFRFEHIIYTIALYIFIFFVPVLITSLIFAFINIKKAKIPGEHCFVKKNIVKISFIFRFLILTSWFMLIQPFVFYIIPMIFFEKFTSWLNVILNLLFISIGIFEIVLEIIVLYKLTNLKIYRIQDSVIEKNNF